MMIVRRKLSPLFSKLRPLLCNHPSLSILLAQTQLPSPPLRNKPVFFSAHLFSSSSSSLPKQVPNLQTLSLSRDGNYDDATATAAVCPGCGIRLQESDPKQPGFFSKPSSKSPNYGSDSHLVPVSFETEFSNSLKAGLLPVDPRKGPEPTRERKGPPVVCARCHSLRHYGKVRDPDAENLLPEFDFYHTVGRRLVSASGARSVVLLVVDAADFDGSFPNRVAKMVSGAIEENVRNWKQGKPGNVPRLLLVLTKIDLLPTELSPTRFEHWVRRRAREGGASVIKQVHFVSAVRNWGVKDLVDDVMELVGPRGNVWAVGTQNAGKSTLINAMGRCVNGVNANENGGGGGGEGGKGGGVVCYLTEAPVPGTTLGIVRVEGVLPGNAKLFDTPGLLNPRQITARLTGEEQRLVHIGKELKPRTYRIKEGHSIHIGGLMRLDTEELPVDSVYVTVWASPYLPLHMGKTENASTLLEEHFGRQLQPPIGEGRVQELGKWVRHEFCVSGSSWDSSSVDISVGGLGWFAIGLKGEATIGVWTYEGVDVVLHDSLIPYRSQTFEVAGFTVSKVVSKADRASSKSRQCGKKRKQSDQEVAVAV